MESVIADGARSIVELSPIIALLVIINLALCWLVRALLRDAKEERALNREALIDNTAVISEFKEIIRSAIQR